jgi:hypothetical protein
MKPRAASAAAATAPRDFSDLLESLLAETSGEHVTLGELLAIVDRRSFGAVMLFLGFISITPLTIIPGGNWLVAATTLLIAGQMLIGRRHPWLPERLVRAKFPRELLVKTVEGGREAAHVADRLTRPRWVFLTRPPFEFLPALACVMAALITFPLGLIPLGPVLPGIAIVLLGVGLTARDGVFLMLAMVALGGACMLLARWLG